MCVSPKKNQVLYFRSQPDLLNTRTAFFLMFTLRPIPDQKRRCGLIGQDRLPKVGARS